MTGIEDLSDPQLKLLRCIHRDNSRHGRPPSYRELERAMGAQSLSVVSYHVSRLEEMNLLTRQKQKARSLRLTEAALALLGEPAGREQGVVFFPIKGDIVAGSPVEPGNGDFATYDDEEGISVDAALLPRRREALFALRVRGHSMIDALVRDRDIVILEKATTARDGQMVAAWLQLEQELTLKHFFLEGERVRLQPANPTLDPIYSPAENVQVQARVVTVLRPDAGRLR